MKNFYKWAEDRKIDLDEIRSVLKEAPPEKEAKSEAQSTKRAGVRSHAYPPLYSRGQYPDSYMRPVAADAAYYQSVEKK